jgi:hypothetical protein
MFNFRFLLICFSVPPFGQLPGIIKKALPKIKTPLGIRIQRRRSKIIFGSSTVMAFRL